MISTYLRHEYPIKYVQAAYTIRQKWVDLNIEIQTPTIAKHSNKNQNPLQMAEGQNAEQSHTVIS